MIKSRLNKIEKMLAMSTAAIDYLVIVLDGMGRHPDEYIVAELRNGNWIRQLDPKESVYTEVLNQHGYESGKKQL